MIVLSKAQYIVITLLERIELLSSMRYQLIYIEKKVPYRNIKADFFN